MSDTELTGLDWLRKSLQDKRVTSSRLASELGLDPAAISRMLRGKRQAKVNECMRIAHLLGLPVEEVTAKIFGVVIPLTEDDSGVASGQVRGGKVSLSINQSVTFQQAARIFAILSEKPE